MDTTDYSVYTGDKAEEICQYIINHLVSHKDNYKRISIQNISDASHYRRAHDGDLYLHSKIIKVSYFIQHGIEPRDCSNHTLFLGRPRQNGDDVNFNLLCVWDEVLDSERKINLPLGDYAVVNNLKEFFEDWFYIIGRDIWPDMLDLIEFYPDMDSLVERSYEEYRYGSCKEYHMKYRREYQTRMLEAFAQGVSVLRLNRESPLRDLPTDVFVNIAKKFTGDPHLINEEKEDIK